MKLSSLNKGLKAKPVIIGLLIAIVSTFTYYPAYMQDSRSYFPETGHSVAGKFLAYWQRHGELAQFGYPISEEMQEVSALNGQTYTIQYFERAEFELHPENQPPYDVLLTPLGSLYYNEKYPNAAPNQIPNPDGPYIFKETGKTIGGAFRAYWESHGGLTQQGYPISDEFTEMSDIDGKPYTVQYFERAEFEYHPENQPPYDVLLTPLGSLRYRERYNGTTTNTPVLITGQLYANPVAAGQYLLWFGDGGKSLYGYDSGTQKKFQLANNLNIGYYIAADTKGVVWLEVAPNQNDNSTLYTVRRYDLEQGISAGDSAISTIRSFSTTSDTHLMALDTVNLYYSKANNDIYMLNLASGAERRLAGVNAGNLVARGGAVLWTEDDCNPCGKFQPVTYVLHLLLPGSTQSMVIAQSEGLDFGGYDFDGSNVVWVPAPTPAQSAWGVRVYNVASGKTMVIASGIAENPLISGNNVVWTDWLDVDTATNHRSISAYDMAAGSVTTVIGNTAARISTQAIVEPQTVAYRIGNSLYIIKIAQN